MADHRVFKLVLLGAEGVGKTSVVNRLVLDQYQDEFAAPTAGCKVHAYQLAVNDDDNDNDSSRTIRVMLWDTSGNPAYHSFLPLYEQGADCYLVCFDVSQPATLDWARARALDLFYRASATCHLVLVGLQADKAATTTTTLSDQAREFAKNKLGGRGVYYEVSAKTGTGSVHAMFHSLASILHYNQFGRPI